MCLGQAGQEPAVSVDGNPPTEVDVVNENPLSQPTLSLSKPYNRLGKKLVEPLTTLINTTPAKSLLYEAIHTVSVRCAAPII